MSSEDEVLIMRQAVEIQPSGPLRGKIRPPGSKSLSLRALLCAALAEGESLLTGLLQSDDTQAMIDCLSCLGIEITQTGGGTRVIGCGGRLPIDAAELYAGDSGATARFLTALLTLGRGIYQLDGSRRLRERPLAELLQALRALGGHIISQSENDCLPIVVHGAGLQGGQTTVACDRSSQFLSALLMVASYAAGEVELVISGEPVSRPYVDLTLAVMKAFGVQPAAATSTRYLIRPGRYCGCRYAVEADASAAGYFFAAAAITQGKITVEGLSRDSRQGELGFCRLLEQMGCQVEYGDKQTTVIGRPLHGIDADLRDNSDLAPTLAAVALFAAGRTSLRGIAHARYKESDRIGDLAAELRKLGAEVKEHADGLEITPRPLHGAIVDPHGDHRLTMSLALVGLKTKGIVINDAHCVSKSYPRFFDDLLSLIRQSRTEG